MTRDEIDRSRPVLGLKVQAGSVIDIMLQPAGSRPKKSAPGISKMPGAVVICAEGCLIGEEN